MRSSCSEDSPGSGIPSALRSIPSLRSLSFVRSISMKPSHPMGASIAYSPECVKGEFSEVGLPLYGVFGSLPTLLVFAWAFTPRPSLLEHLPSHLLHLAFGVHLHIPACACLLGYLVGYLIRLTFSVLVRISPRTRILGYPLCEVLVGGLGIHARPLQGHVLHHDLSGLRRLLCLLAYLLCYVIRRLHGLHGWRRLHGRHRLHGFQRVFPHAGQRARLDVAPLDPPLNLFGPALGLPCLPLLIAYAHLLCLPHWCRACRLLALCHARYILLLLGTPWGYAQALLRTLLGALLTFGEGKYCELRHNGVLRSSPPEVATSRCALGGSSASQTPHLLHDGRRERGAGGPQAGAPESTGSGGELPMSKTLGGPSFAGLRPLSWLSR